MEKDKLERLDYDDPSQFCTLAGAAPCLFLIDRKAYPVSSYEEVLRLIFHFAMGDPRFDEIVSQEVRLDDSSDPMVYQRAGRVIASVAGHIPSSIQVARFRYCLCYQNSQSYLNAKTISYILKDTDIGKRIRIYFAEADADPSKLNSLEKQKARSLKNVKLCTKNQSEYLLSQIEDSLLSKRDRMFRDVAFEFDKRAMIGDCELDQATHDELIAYMCDILADYYNGRSLPFQYGDKHRPDAKAYCVGLVMLGIELYNSKGNGGFWNRICERFGIAYNPLVSQSLGWTYQEIMEANGKKFIRRANGKDDYVDNICMQAFATNTAADKLFDYLYWVYSRALDYSLKNYGADFTSAELVEDFEYQYDHPGPGKAKKFLSHVAMAVVENEGGAKNRLAWMLKKIDWAVRADFNPEQGRFNNSRLDQALKNWMLDPKSRFQKDKKANERHGPRSSGTWHARPTLERRIVDGAPEYSFYFPKTRFSGSALSEGLQNEGVAYWHVRDKQDKDLIDPIPAELCRFEKGNGLAYVEEQRKSISDLSVLFEDLYFSLEDPGDSCKDITGRARKEIKADSIRVFDEGNDFVNDYASQFPRGNVTVLAMDKEAFPTLAEHSEKEEEPEDIGFGVFEKAYYCLIDDDLVILKNGYFVPVGSALKTGLNGGKKSPGTTILADGHACEIYTRLPSLLIEVDKAEVPGVKIYLEDNVKPKLLTNLLKEAKATEKNFIEEGETFDGKKTNCRFLIRLEGLIQRPGLHFVQVDANAKILEGPDYIAFLPDFNYTFTPSKSSDDQGGLFDQYLIFNDHGQFSFPQEFKSSYFEQGARKVIAGSFDETKQEHLPIVKDRQIHLPTAVDGKEVELAIQVPALYWRFSQGEPWKCAKMHDIRYKSLPEFLIVDAPFSLEGSQIQCIEGGGVGDAITPDRLGDAWQFPLNKIKSIITQDDEDAKIKLRLADGTLIDLFTLITHAKVTYYSNPIWNEEEATVQGKVTIDGDDDSEYIARLQETEDQLDLMMDDLGQASIGKDGSYCTESDTEDLAHFKGMVTYVVFYEVTRIGFRKIARKIGSAEFVLEDAWDFSHKIIRIMGIRPKNEEEADHIVLLKTYLSDIRQISLAKDILGNGIKVHGIRDAGETDTMALKRLANQNARAYLGKVYERGEYGLQNPPGFYMLAIFPDENDMSNVILTRFESEMTKNALDALKGLAPDASFAKNTFFLPTGEMFAKRREKLYREANGQQGPLYDPDSDFLIVDNVDYTYLVRIERK